MKKIFTGLLTILILLISFFYGFSSSFIMPVYAESIPPGYTQVTNNDQLVDAFLAYCKSRDSNIESSILGASASYVYNALINISEAIGISLTDVQASLYYIQDDNIGIKWFMTSVGVQAFNDIFAYLIHEEGLEVGQPADKIVYSGRTFTDADGVTCLVYVLPTDYNWNNSDIVPVQFGSYYKYTSSQLVNFYENGITRPVYNLTSSVSDSTVIIKATNGQYYNPIYAFYNIEHYPEQFYAKSISSGSVDLQGYRIIGCLESDPETLYFGSFNYMYRNDDPRFNDFPSYNWQLFWRIPQADSEATNVNFVSNNITNYYTGDTIINNEGDIIYNNPDQDDWNPILPDIPSEGSNPSGGNTIDWPDIDLPDFDLPNFSLGDLRSKFPFSIPFDIVSILGVINADPVAPVIQEDIPIRIDLMNVDYTIPINLDMSDTVYDNFARIIRAVEFIGFCIGLIHLTIRLVKG